MTVEVRRPAVGDVDELARINIDAWRAAYTGIVPRARLDQMDIATYRQRWTENVTGDRPGVDFWAADVDGRLAGYAIGGPYRPRNDAGPDVVTELAELYAIYVDPPRQGCGAGTAVHDALLAALAEQGYSEVALWVLVDNEPGRRWYARRGWTPDGAVAMWSAGDSILPELRMRRGLPGPCAARLG